MPKAQLTGVGFCTFDNNLIAPSDAGLGYRNVDALDILPLVNTSGTSSTCVYPFHDACWQLLLAMLPSVSVQEVVAQPLFEILFTTECPDSSFFQFGHDYGGAARFQIPHANGSSPWCFFLANPFTIPELTTLLDHTSTFSNAAPLAFPESGLPTVAVWNSVDLFATFPLEIIVLILSCLPSRDVANFRLASRAIADVSTVSRLGQSFWESRFAPGLELDFICPGRSRHCDWRLYYLKIKDWLPHNPGLRNRRRLWKLLQPVAGSVNVSLDPRRKTLGIPADLNLSTLMDIVGKDQGSLMLTHHIGGESISKYHGEQLSFGCRQMDHRAAIIPSPLLAARAPSSNWSYGVSLVTFNGREYVSSLRFISQSLEQDEHECRSGIGYLLPPKESRFQFQDDEAISGIEVAVCASGVVGIKFLVTPPRDVGGWVGRIDGPDVAFGRLLPVAGNKLAAFAACTDVCGLLQLLISAALQV